MAACCTWVQLPARPPGRTALAIVLLLAISATCAAVPVRRAGALPLDASQGLPAGVVRVAFSPAALQRLREARPGSEDLSLLQISDGPASWGALLTSKEVTQSALKEAAAKLHDALAAESHRAEEAARDMDSELEVVERERVEAEARASRARNATAEMQREMKWLHERITMAERGVERLRDPAPAVPHVGGFRLYFQGGERLGDDDRKVVAAALKRQYPDALNLTCLCVVKEGDRSALGPVLGGLNCSCYQHVEEHPVVNATAAADNAAAAADNATEPAAAAADALRASIRVGAEHYNLRHLDVLHILSASDGPRTRSSPPELNITVVGRGKAAAGSVEIDDSQVDQGSAVLDAADPDLSAKLNRAMRAVFGAAATQQALQPGQPAHTGGQFVTADPHAWELSSREADALERARKALQAAEAGHMAATAAAGELSDVAALLRKKRAGPRAQKEPTADEVMRSEDEAVERVAASYEGTERILRKKQLELLLAQARVEQARADLQAAKALHGVAETERLNKLLAEQRQHEQRQNATQAEAQQEAAPAEEAEDAQTRLLEEAALTQFRSIAADAAAPVTAAPGAAAPVAARPTAQLAEAAVFRPAVEAVHIADVIPQPKSQVVEPTVEPQVAEPQVVEPTVEPQAVKSQVVEPQAVEPTVVEPQAVEPQVVEPQMVEPQVVEPTVVEPTVVEPTVVEPQAVEPQAADKQAAEYQADDEQASDELTTDEEEADELTTDEPTTDEPTTNDQADDDEQPVDEERAEAEQPAPATPPLQRGVASAAVTNDPYADVRFDDAGRLYWPDGSRLTDSQRAEFMQRLLDAGALQNGQAGGMVALQMEESARRPNARALLRGGSRLQSPAPAQQVQDGLDASLNEELGLDPEELADLHPSREDAVDAALDAVISSFPAASDTDLDADVAMLEPVPDVV